MALTKANIRKFTRRALKDNNLNANIESIEWSGQRCKEINGPLYFRNARVILKSNNGSRFMKCATIDTSGYFRIS